MTDKDEFDLFEKCTPLQKQVGLALEDMGYRWMYGLKFKLSDASLEIDLRKIDDMKDLIRICYKNGAQEKVWQIKRVLEVE